MLRIPLGRSKSHPNHAEEEARHEHDQLQFAVHSFVMTVEPEAERRVMAIAEIVKMLVDVAMECLD